MGLIENLLLKALGYGGIKEPTFLKEFDKKSNEQLLYLNELLGKVENKDKEAIEKEILKVRSGLAGENNVNFELKNSRLPFLCLHDIRIEYKGYTGQFDFIIIFQEFILVIETKNLYGDISIDDEGNFFREYYFKNRKIKEGIYSPITQNRRHVELLREILVDHKYIKICPVHSLIVIANDKTVISKRYAKGDIKKQIVKYDQLRDKLAEFQLEQVVKLSDKKMYQIAETILSLHKPITIDYMSKLGIKLAVEKNLETINKPIKPIEVKEDTIQTVNQVDEDKIVQETDISKIFNMLRNYRYTKTKEKNVKAYVVFNNIEMDQLISVRPKSKEEFLGVHGFGEKKYEEYGEDIISIFTKHIENITEKLKDYRLQKSRDLGIKAYEVFSNQQLDDIVALIPKSIEDLATVKYFHQDRIDKFGNDIIQLIKDNF